jgi:hypothetical protein
MYILHELKFDADNIVTAVVFTKALSEDISAKAMFELLPGPNGFIPYADLTEKIVISWLENHTDMPNLDLVLAKNQQQHLWLSTTQFPWG